MLMGDDGFVYQTTAAGECVCVWECERLRLRFNI